MKCSSTFEKTVQETSSLVSPLSATRWVAWLWGLPFPTLISTRTRCMDFWVFAHPIWAICTKQVSFSQQGCGSWASGRPLSLWTSWEWTILRTQKIVVSSNFHNMMVWSGSSTLFSLVLTRINMLHLIRHVYRFVKKLPKIEAKETSTSKWLTQCYQNFLYKFSTGLM